jgi:hypothetical protein
VNSSVPPPAVRVVANDTGTVKVRAMSDVPPHIISPAFTLNPEPIPDELTSEANGNEIIGPVVSARSFVVVACETLKTAIPLVFNAPNDTFGFCAVPPIVIGAVPDTDKTPTALWGMSGGKICFVPASIIFEILIILYIENKNNSIFKS